MAHKMIQLYRRPDGAYDCHVAIIPDDRSAAPVRRFYRRISWASVERFHAVSGGYLTAYSDKPRVAMEMAR